MKRHQHGFLFWFQVCLFFSMTFNAYGENEPQTVPGGATIQTLMSNLESAASKQNMMQLADGTIGTEGNVGTGIHYTFSDNVRIYNLPLSYSISDRFVTGLTVPWVYKRKKGYFEDDVIENEGLGDISVFIEHILKKEKFRLSSTFTLKMPTGYYKRHENGKETQPLGTGSYDYIVGGALIYKPDLSEKLRFTSSASYRLNGSSSIKEEATYNNITGTYYLKARNGNVFNISFGSIYFSNIAKLLFYGDLGYMNIQRGSIGYSDASGIVSVSTTRKDSLSVIDLTLGSKYQLSEDSAFRLGITLPAWTAYDKDAGDTENRQIVGDFGFDYVF